MSSHWIWIPFLLAGAACRAQTPRIERVQVALESFDWDLDMSRRDLTTLQVEVHRLADGADRVRLEEAASRLEDRIAAARGDAAALRGTDAAHPALVDLEERLAGIREDVAHLRAELVTAQG